MRKDAVNLLFTFIFAGATLSCSYRLVKESSASLPSGVDSISIPLAGNRTIEAGLEDVFSLELKKRLAADGRVTISEKGLADAELRCVLKDIRTAPVSYTREGRVAAERVVLEAECALAIAESGSVVWKTGSLAASEEYAAGDDYLINEQARAQALLEVCRDLCESIRNALLDSF
jgi:outer membrane lipopolysaccharide assembly protein LptE/RlpB